MTEPNFIWAIYTKETKGKTGHSVRADRMEVTPTGALVFYENKALGDTIIHVQAPGTYVTCEILSQLTGCATHSEPLAAH